MKRRGLTLTEIQGILTRAGLGGAYISGSKSDAKPEQRVVIWRESANIIGLVGRGSYADRTDAETKAVAAIRAARGENAVTLSSLGHVVIEGGR